LSRWIFHVEQDERWCNKEHRYHAHIETSQVNMQSIMNKQYTGWHKKSKPLPNDQKSY